MNRLYLLRFLLAIVAGQASLFLGPAPHALSQALSSAILAEDESQEPELDVALENLKSESYVKRQQAIQYLKAHPIAAMQGLKALGTSFDPEVALQAQRLLVEIKTSQVEKLLQTFLQTEPAGEESISEGTSGTPFDWDQTLPLWSRFHQELDDTHQVRVLYADALKQNTSEFFAIADNSASVSENWERLLQTDSEHTTLSRSTIAAVLLLAIDKGLWGSNGMEDRLISELENRLAANAIVFRSSPFQNLNRRLLVKWCQQRGFDGPHFSSYHSFLQLALQCQIPEAFPQLLAVANSQRISAYPRGTAVLYAVALAREEDLLELESLVNDGTVIAEPRYSTDTSQLQCCISDYALFGLAIRSGMDTQLLGMEIENPENVLALDRKQLGFATPADRKRAIENWLAFREKKYPTWPPTAIKLP